MTTLTLVPPPLAKNSQADDDAEFAIILQVLGTIEQAVAAIRATVERRLSEVR